MQTYDEGDYATLTLEVGGGSPESTVALEVRSPTGSLSQPTTRTDDEGATWSAQVLVDEPGIWRVMWTVEGDGQGSEGYTFGVRPSLTDPPLSGRLYATTADYARWLGDVPPDDAIQSLTAASRALDHVLVGARYTTDDAEMPTHPRTRQAFADATCAQAAYTLNGGSDQDGSELGVGVGSIGIGSISITAKGGSGSSSNNSTGGGGGTFSPTAKRILHEAGLLPIRAGVIG